MIIEQMLGSTDYPQKSILQKLICYYMGLTHEQMWMQVTDEVSDAQLHDIRAGYEQYTVHKKPLEYIVGKVKFFDIDFVVTPATLIPRPETEYMILAIDEFLQANGQSHVLIDVGTGCGVLGISVLLRHSHLLEQAFLCDLSTDALAVAKQNLALLYKQSVPVTFVESNLVAFVEEQKIITQTPIVLVANLPYIPDETFDNNADQTVKAWEPRMAFVWGNDGLDLYRIMFAQLFALRDAKSIGSVTMFLEMMTRQTEILVTEFGNRILFEEVKTFHFNIRIVKAVLL